MKTTNYASMTIKERIVKFIEKHPEPRPISLRIQASGRNLDFFIEAGLHNKRYYNHEATPVWEPSIIRCPTKQINASQLNYDEELGLLEIAGVRIDGRVNVAPENRKWAYDWRNFIPVGKKTLYNTLGEYGPYDCCDSRGSCYTYSTIEFFRAYGRLKYDREDFKKQILAFLDGPKKIKGGVYPGNWEYNWILSDWFHYMEKQVCKSSKAQQKVDAFNELFNFEKRGEFTKDNATKWYWKNPTVARFHSKEDKVAFRVYTLDKDPVTGEENNKWIESKRLFIDFGKKTPVIQGANYVDGGDWVPNGSCTQNQFDCPIDNLGEVYKFNRFEALKQVGSDCNHFNQRRGWTVYDLNCFVRRPFAEQLIKMGCLTSGQRATVSAGDCWFLGQEANEKSKSVLTKYGLTRKQILAVELEYNAKITFEEERTGGCPSISWPFKTIKEILDTNDISSYDAETIQNLAHVILFDFGRRTKTHIINIGIPAERINFIKRLQTMQKKNPHLNIWRTFEDTMATLGALPMNQRPAFQYSELKDASDILRLHDVCNQVHAQYMEEVRERNRMATEERMKELEKLRKKTDKVRQGFNYEEGDFVIKLPDNASEIGQEGRNLHHCVGGYINSHVEGTTTILFLRRKSEINKSFYTIEVKALGAGFEVIQIHGFGNKWLGNNPEAIPCVYHWAKKNNIKIPDTVLRSTSTTYGGYGAKLVDMPVV